VGDGIAKLIYDQVTYISNCEYKYRASFYTGQWPNTHSCIGSHFTIINYPFKDTTC
jgi:hypothetical protein